MIRTLDDLVATGKRLGVRLDVNSPLVRGGLADDARLEAHLDTLSELTDDGGRVVILAHQGRPGGESFRTLEPHADRLDHLLSAPVRYVDSIFSADARDRVRSLEDGAVLVLENTRFYSEEYIEFEPSRAAETYLVECLEPVLDAYVNDAFAAAHRSQPSLVGFPTVLPSFAGRLMERELAVLGSIDETARPRVYFLAGAKVPDSLAVIENVLGHDLADEVLTGGLLGNVFLAVSGVDLGCRTEAVIEEFGADEQYDRAAALLRDYEDRIRIPRDVAFERDGTRREVPVADLPVDAPAYDLGARTIEEYGERLATAATAVLNGPAGVTENELFTTGTREVYRAATRADESIVGGGDTGAVLRQLGITGFDHVSTGGGAAMRMLAGETLAGVAALDDAH